MMGKKKILFILHVPPPVNGAAIMGQYLKGSKVINQHFETDYINLTASFTLDKIGKGSLYKTKVVYQILRNTFFALRKKSYDLCYVSLTTRGTGFYKDVLVVALLKLLNQRIIYHFHNKGVKKFSKKRVNHLLYRFVFKNTKCILLSPRLYADIERYVDERNVHYCPNGIENSTNLDIEIGEDKGADTPCQFLFLSNMMREKGVLELLKACRILKLRNFSFECHFIGAWSDISKDFFEQTVSGLGLGKQVFAHGRKYHQEKFKFFAQADVFVFPTYYHNECFPLVLLEAMQYGLPIITTPEGAISDMVLQGKTGILTPQKDTAALANAMEKLLRNPLQGQKMGEAGKNRYHQRYTLSNFEKRMQGILQTVIAANQK
ncbi:glycosyltransferase family 4 protein [Maribacter sp. 2307ULW6-5]|uniref:glycosyltransferase family 4 protein n=1 Tax=Maribacter sp. 2307ULW6-5 TaxID=3386275 RepID=UPI0039BC91DE